MKTHSGDFQTGDRAGDLQVEISSSPQDEEWDDFVLASPDSHFEQTARWGHLQRHKGWTPIRLLLRRGASLAGGCQILERPFKRYGKVGYIQRGPLIAADDPSLHRRLLDAIINRGRESGMIYLALKPPYSAHAAQSDFANRGFMIKPDILPPRTPELSSLVLDLKPPLQEVLKRMRAEKRRYIRQGRERGIKVREGSAADIDTFNQLLLTLCRRRGVTSNVPPGAFLSELWASFAPRGLIHLFLAEYGHEPVSGQLLIRTGRWARAWRVGWSGLHSHCRPNETIYWEAIQWAKLNGCERFDLAGFDSEAARAIKENRPLPANETASLTHFKLGFGGQVIVSPCYCYFFNRACRFCLKAGGSRLLNAGLFQHLARRSLSGFLSGQE